jgi:hypothetical protein
MAESLLQNVFWKDGKYVPIWFSGHSECHPPPGALLVALQAEGPSGWDATQNFHYQNNSKLVLGNWYNTTLENMESTHWTSLYLPYASAGYIQSEIFTPYHLTHRSFFNKPRYFIAYMQNNCFAARERLWDMLVQFTTKHHLGVARALCGCYGSYKNTSRFSHSKWPIPGWRDEDSMMGTSYDKKVQSFNDFRFVLSTQNAWRNVGYVTHRISDTFMSGAIPLYLGDRQVIDIFNKDAMILIDLQNPDLALKRLLEVGTNNTLYEQMRHTPVLSKAQACKFFSWHPALSHDCNYEQHQVILLQMERLLKNQLS